MPQEFSCKAIKENKIKTNILLTEKAISSCTPQKAVFVMLLEVYRYMQ